MNGLMFLMALAADPGASSEVLEALAPTQGGLTSKTVVEKAVLSSPSIAKADATHARAKIEADFAFFAFAPRIDGQFGYFRQKSFSFPDFSDPNADPIEIDSGVQIVGRLSVPVSEYFLTILHGYRATFTAEEIARHQQRAERETVAFNAMQAYLDLVRARASAYVAQKSLDVLSEQLEDLRRLADAGLSTEGDVLQVKAQLANAKVVLTQSKGGVLVLEERLRRLLHIKERDLKHGENLLDVNASSSPVFEDALAEAMEQRADVQALEGLIVARQQQESLNFGMMFPRLTVDGDITYANPNQRAFQFSGFGTFWTLGFNVNWSPNDFVRAYSETEKSGEDVEAARADLELLSDAVAVEVANAVTGYRTTYESIEAAREGLEAAEGSFKDRQNLLSAGEGTTRELLLSEQDLRRAQLQLINAHLDLRLARASLDRALGRLAKEVAE